MRQSLENFIHECMLDDERGAKLSMLSLVHMVGTQQQEIHTTRFGTKSWDAKSLAKMFRGKAESFSQDLQSVQTFQLLAFWGESIEPGARQPFMVNPEQDHSGLFTEEANEKGQRQQTMRHGEMIVQQAYRRQQAQDEFSIRFMQEMNRSLITAMSENREMFAVMKEMMMASALENHERDMAKLKYMRDTEERKKWMAAAPPLINMILGREIFPQSTADTALIETIADSLSEEDVMKLASMLPPNLMGPIASRMNEAMVKKRKEQEQMKMMSEIASRHPDPEADASGEMPRKLRNGSS